MKRVFSASAALPLIAAAAPGAAAGPMFLNSVGEPGDGFVYSSSELLEARFRADTTNWDLRLENNGSPTAGDNQANLTNGRNAFEGYSFDFALSYSQALQQVEWEVSRIPGFSESLFFDSSDFGSLNSIQFSSTGSRATMTVEDLMFSGLGISESAWPNLSTSPDGSSFAQTNFYLGDGSNLLGSGDWQLSGRVSMDNFTHNNPGEGAKINIRLIQVAQIPSPSGLAGLAIAAGFCAMRRRS